MADRDSSNEKRPRLFEALAERIGARASRKIKARGERGQDIWFWLGMFGLVGWSVTIPTLLGAALGAWMDARWPSQYSWTLTFLLLGVVVGCLNAWYWVNHEYRRD